MTTSNIAGAIDALKREVEKERGELERVERELAARQADVHKLEADRKIIRIEHADNERELQKLQQELQDITKKH